jgi:protoporphyrinogen oxidase
MRVGIVGGGVLGLSLAYFLARSGVHVTLFEGKDRPGGLVDYLEVDGAWIDKYYHCILSSDADLLALVAELGLQDRVRFTETKQGFYRAGRLYPVSSGKDFLLFPPLTLVERVRLGLTILAALRVNDWRALEEIAVEDWLVGLGGRGTFEKLWKPLLRAKFDGHYQQTPATYIWSRLKRTTSTRTAAGQKERMGYFVGSYKVFIDRLVERIEAAGAQVRLRARVQQVLVDDGRVTGVLAGDERVPLDAVIVTTPVPILHGILPEPYRAALDLPSSSEYLGVICGLLLLDRRLTPYYTLYIGDEQIPFTGLIETTNLIAPEHAGGHHLVYLPKYVTPDSPYLGCTDAELHRLYLMHLKAMFPGFQETWVRRLFVFRERFVEPLHQIGRRRPVLPISTALPGLYIVNNGQIYPELTNCQASVRHALGALPAVVGERAIGAAGRAPDHGQPARHRGDVVMDPAR